MTGPPVGQGMFQGFDKAYHSDPLGAWRAWLPHAQGHALDAGYFLAEERPDEVLAAIKRPLNAACDAG